ncbi:uncharacterized protein K02A2.6-like [Armigeres subalbatus]|uniref:uncharacterized protein K02A2.6-like n=1 Tax=Armigeres subalbatus TaxID=124917 RepID=UPI002ED1B8D1
MDSMIEHHVQSCQGCMLVAAPEIQPITRTEMPQRPWMKIAIDFTEIPGGNHLLVATDYFSRYIEIIIQSSMTATQTITKLREVFARFGYPEEILCDNGQPFSSDEFSTFCKRNGIKIKHSVPYAAFQNGQVERQNRTILKSIKISAAMGRDWKSDLQDFLHAYRATPHSVTNFSPAELMFGWNIRDKLPNSTRKVSINKARQNDARRKQKGKLYSDEKRKAKESTIDVGDYVVVKNFIRKNKLSPNFNPQQYKVIQRDGTRLQLKNLETGVICSRHVNHTKRTLNKNPLLDKDAIDENSNQLSAGIQLQDAETLTQKETKTQDVELPPSSPDELKKRRLTPEANQVKPKRQKCLPKRFLNFELYNLNNNELINLLETYCKQIIV